MKYATVSGSLEMQVFKERHALSKAAAVPVITDRHVRLGMAERTLSATLQS